VHALNDIEFEMSNTTHEINEFIHNFIRANALELMQDFTFTVLIKESKLIFGLS
jgi:hypothetical protein